MLYRSSCTQVPNGAILAEFQDTDIPYAAGHEVMKMKILAAHGREDINKDFDDVMALLKRSRKVASHLSQLNMLYILQIAQCHHYVRFIISMGHNTDAQLKYAKRHCLYPDELGLM